VCQASGPTQAESPTHDTTTVMAMLVSTEFPFFNAKPSFKRGEQDPHMSQALIKEKPGSQCSWTYLI